MAKRYFGTLTAWLALVILLSASVRSQDYVGILPEMLKPEVAARLGLSDEQREKVSELTRNRMSGAIGLAQSLQEAPLDQRDALRAEFSAESEKMAFELLDAAQQDKLAKYRVEWLGMLSLADANVAQALNLADWQSDIVSTWATKVRSNRRGAEADRTRNDAQRAIRAEISDSQWAMWQVMAGQIGESTAGPPMPPEKNVPAAFVAAKENAPPASPSDNSVLPVDEIRVEMNFQGQPWNEVIQWLATQADLSLQTDVVPPGSFTFRDRSRSYSISQAMDVMNISLLSTGHTLMKNGRMLRCVNFENQKFAGELIKELAEYVSEEELARRGYYEPVKYIFTLVRLDPEEIKEEVKQLLSIHGSVVSIPSAGQLIVTDMAGTVRIIQKMILRAEDPSSSRGSSIQTFPLQHISADEVLSVARPLLGLADELNTSDEISISTNTFGTTIYSKGSTEKVQILRDLVTQMDVAPDATEGAIEYELPVLRRHKVANIDMQLAYEIVSQLLAGSPDVRLAQDAVASQLVLQARAGEHDLVAKTLNELSNGISELGFEVIQLKKLDTQLAIAAVKKFLGLTDTAEGGGPVIDGDLLARQVWVQGSEAEVKKIRELLSKLEENATNSDPWGDNVRVIPIKGRSAMDALEQVQQLWGATNNVNPIRVLKLGESGVGTSLRSFSPKPQVKSDAAPAQETKQEGTPAEVRQGDAASTEKILGGKFTVFQQGSDPSASDAKVFKDPLSGSEILIMEGPSGLIISSEDKEALARFESMLQMFATSSGLNEPTIIYLRNIKATAAKELLETILSGAASTGGSGGGLLGDMAGGILGGFGGGMLGAMMGGGGGDLLGSGTGMASGDYTITADPRLNALIVKASPGDMSLIEQLLEVIDQVESPISIETRGQIAMIPVITQDVSQVLSVIKNLYGDRIEGNSSSRGSSGGGGGGGGGGQPNPADIINALRGAGGGSSRGGRGGSTELAEAKISISAETETNSLIVIAQPQDIAEIQLLVKTIDDAGATDQEVVELANLGGIVSGTVFQESITRMMGSQVKANVVGRDGQNSSSSGGGGGGGGGGSSDSGSDDAATQARRAAFAEAMRSRFGGGGTPGGGGDGGRGGTPGGGSGFGGFGGFGGGGPPGGFGGFGGRGGSPGGGGGGGQPSGRGGR